MPLNFPMEKKFNSSDDETYGPSGESSSLSDGAGTIESFSVAESPKSHHQKLLEMLTVARMAVLSA